MPTLAEIAAKYGGTPDASLAAKHGGVLDSLAAKELPGGYAPMTPEQTEAGLAMNRPKAMTQRWLRTAPYVAGAAGALITKNPRGAGLAAEAAAGLMQMLGSGAGGVLGKAAEHQLGGTWAETDAERWRSVAMSGALQAMIQAPASGVGVAGEGLVGLRGLARNRAVRQEQGKYIKREAGKYREGRARLAEELPRARQEWKEASKATKGAVMASPEKTNIDAVVDRVVAERVAKMPSGATVTPRMRERIRGDMRRVVKEINETYARRLGKVGGEWNMEQSQWLKQKADALAKNIQEGRAAGLRSTPNDISDFGDAMRGLIEEAIPEGAVSPDIGIKQLNQRTSAALEEYEPLLKKKKATPARGKKAIEIAAGAEGIKQSVLASRSANPVRLVRAIPTPGSVAQPVVGYRPGTAAEFGGKMGELMAGYQMPGDFANALARVSGPGSFAGPRLLAMLLEAKRMQDEEAARLGAPADVTNPQPRAAKEE